MIDPIWVLTLYTITLIALTINAVSCERKLKKMKKGELKSEKTAFKKNGNAFLTIILCEIMIAGIFGFTQGSNFTEKVEITAKTLFFSTFAYTKVLVWIGYFSIRTRVRKQCAAENASV